MNYIEARHIVDEIVDGKKVIDPKDAGVMSAAVMQAKKLMENAKKRMDRRNDRFLKLQDIKAPDVILENESTMLGIAAERYEALKESYEDMMALSALKNICAYDALDAIEDSRRRGCRDCKFRLSRYNGGKGIDSSFYCGLKEGFSEEEKEELRSEGTVYLIEDGSQVKLTAEEVEEYISKGRPIFTSSGFNTPCKSYEPSEYPLSQCMRSEKAMVKMKEILEGKLPDLEEEFWDEDSLYCNLVFCRINANRMGSAEHRLLAAIFGNNEETT